MTEHIGFVGEKIRDRRDVAAADGVDLLRAVAAHAVAAHLGPQAAARQ